jgi:ATP-binding cassette subfamily B protein
MPSKDWKAPFQYEKVALDGVDADKNKRAKNMGATLKRIWGYLSKQKAMLYLVIAMVVASSGLGLLGPYLIGVSLDNSLVTQ